MFTGLDTFMTTKPYLRQRSFCISSSSIQTHLFLHAEECLFFTVSNIVLLIKFGRVFASIPSIKGPLSSSLSDPLSVRQKQSRMSLAVPIGASICLVAVIFSFGAMYSIVQDIETMRFEITDGVQDMKVFLTYLKKWSLNRGSHTFAEQVLMVRSSDLLTLKEVVSMEESQVDDLDFSR